MRTHRPLLGIAVCFSIGILASQWNLLSFRWLCVVTLLLLLFSILFMRKKTASAILVFLVFTMLGAVFARSNQAVARSDIYKVARYYRKRPVMLEGIVVSEVQTKDFFKGKKTTCTLQVRQLKTKWGWRKKTGKVLVNVFRDLALSYGDYIRLEGKMYEPFDFSSDSTFSYRDYLSRRGIYLIASVKKQGYVEVMKASCGNPVKAVALRIKERLKNILEKHLTPNESGIMQAILLGDRSGIPPHIKELFVQTGTAHILAISGLHVGIVAFLIFMVFKIMPISRKAACILTIVFLIFYAFLTGARPSVIRATIMAVILIAGFVVERETDLINSLSLAAIIILIVNPLTIFDVGFQLSFISVLAIITIYPKIVQYALRFEVYKRSRTVSLIVKSFAVSLAAWLGVAGLIAYYFRIITPVTVFANLLIIPCMSVIVTLGFTLLLFGIVCAKCAFIVSYCVKATLSAMVSCVYLFDQLPGAHFYVTNVSHWHIVSYYIILILLLASPALMKLTKLWKYATVNPVKKKILLIIIFSLLLISTNSYAFWMWTPETNKWVNPKYAVKDTPGEQLEYALESYNAGDYKKAIREFQKLIKNYPRAREAAEAQFYIAVSLEDQEQLYAAFKAYQKVIDKYPFSERSAEIVSRQYRVGEKLLDGEGKRNKIVGAIIGSDYDVVDVFKTVIKNAPYGSLAAPSQYKIGLYLQEKGLYQEARDEFEKVINDYPDSEWVKGAKYQIALVDSQRSSDAPYDQRVTQAAKEEFKEFVKDYPDARLSENAKKQINALREKEAENAFLVARFYEKQKDYKAARIYYNTVVRDFSDSSFAAKALEKVRQLDLK